jgi:cell filamentation protein
MIDSYYDFKNKVLKNKLNITDYDTLKKAEKYYFGLGLKELTERKYFSTEQDYMPELHYILFNQMYDWAGKYRLIDIEREEPALGGLSVIYSRYDLIGPNVDKVFLEIKRVKLGDLSLDEKLNYIINIAIKLWQIHPFRDCNTRTLIAFINQYCQTGSLMLETDILKNNLDFFRRALVAATFDDPELEVIPNKSHVLRILKDAF